MDANGGACVGSYLPMGVVARGLLSDAWDYVQKLSRVLAEPTTATPQAPCTSFEVSLKNTSIYIDGARFWV
jgi:hypothetical protein